MTSTQATEVGADGTATTAANDRLATLRRDYAANLRAVFNELQKQRAALHAANWSADAVVTVVARFHELAGSAGTFGFNAIAECSRSVEQALSLLHTTGLSDSAKQTQIDRQIDELLALPLPDPDALEALTLSTMAGPATRKTQNQNASNAPLEGRTIFIVDDNLLVAEQLSVQLRYFGFEVTTFGRLSEFSDAFRQAQPDIVLLDIDFPEENTTGPAVFGQLIHELGQSPAAIFMSSHDGIRSRLAAVRAGGQRYLVKPVAIGDLTDAIDSVTCEEQSLPERVLIVDDTLSMCKLYSAILAHAGMQTRYLTNPLEVLNTLSEFQPDLVLIDLYMPECSGPELAAVIRQVGAYVGLPIVYLSAETDRKKQLSAMQLGGDDFLTKPIDAEHLVAAVKNRTSRSRQIRALMKNDSLTGLLNHISFLEAATIELSRARRAGLPGTVAMIDLDNFQSVNDTYGHPVGDRVLKSIARQLRQRLRNVDLIGRYGGEEFAVLFSGTDGRTALRVINSIREDFSRIAHSSAQGAFNATFSCGLATFDDFAAIDKMVAAADKGLYEAKRRGRNCAVLVTPPPAKS
jgi:diguanylate cyclase (GGDEF)-like protein